MIKINVKTRLTLSTNAQINFRLDLCRSFLSRTYACSLENSDKSNKY